MENSTTSPEWGKSMPSVYKKPTFPLALSNVISCVAKTQQQHRCMSGSGPIGGIRILGGRILQQQSASSSSSSPSIASCIRPAPPHRPRILPPLFSVVQGRGERTRATRRGGGEGEEEQGEMGAAASLRIVSTTVGQEDDNEEQEEEEDVAQEENPGPEGEDEKQQEDEGQGEEGNGGKKKGSVPDLSAETKRLDELEQEIWKMAGREFKITSYVELSRVLFEDLKLPVVKQPSNKVLGGVRTSFINIHTVLHIYIHCIDVYYRIVY